MPRGPRAFVPDAYYHLFSRGSNRQAISIVDGDRYDFLGCLATALSKHDLTCVAYCLMPNHYHLVLRVPDGRVSRAVKHLNARYALRFNQRYGRDAHLFKNRFGGVLLETEAHFLWACGYIVANPVRAHLCSSPEEWPWSSYRASIGLEQAPPFLDVAELLSHFPEADDPPEERYSRFVSTCARTGAIDPGP